MKHFGKGFSGAGLFLIVLSWLPSTSFTLSTPALGQNLSAAEQLYASLAQLPDDSRNARLVEGAKMEGKLAIIQTLPSEYDQKLIPDFSKKYPFLKLDITRMGSQDAPDRIIAEETAGRHLTDLVVNALPDSTGLIEQNMAARYPTPAVAKVLPNYEGFVDRGQNRWTPVYWSEYGMSYNSDLLPADQAPKDWFDLCKPQFSGTFSFEPEPIKLLVGMHELLGDDKLKEWLACVGKNKPIVQRGNTARVNLMLGGDHLIQGANYFYDGMRMKRDNPKVPFQPVYSAPILGFAGVVIINRNTPNPNAAALFADFMLDKEAQQFLYEQMRGPLTLPHPYMPKDIHLVAFNYQSIDLVNRLVGYWDQYIGH